MAYAPGIDGSVPTPVSTSAPEIEPNSMTSFSPSINPAFGNPFSSLGVNPNNMTEKTYIVETENNGTFYVTGPNSNTFDPNLYVNNLIAANNDTNNEKNNGFNSAALSGVNPNDFSQRAWIDEDENGNIVSIRGSNFNNFAANTAGTIPASGDYTPYSPASTTNSFQTVPALTDEMLAQKVKESDVRDNNIVTVHDFQSYFSKTGVVAPSEIANYDSYSELYDASQQYDVFGILNKQFSNSIDNLTSENGKIGTAWGDVDTEFSSIFSKCENLFNINGLGIEKSLEPLKESYGKAKAAVDNFLAEVSAEYASVSAKKAAILEERARAEVAARKRAAACTTAE